MFFLVLTKKIIKLKVVVCFCFPNKSLPNIITATPPPLPPAKTMQLPKSPKNMHKSSNLKIPNQHKTNKNLSIKSFPPKRICFAHVSKEIATRFNCY